MHLYLSLLKLKKTEIILVASRLAMLTSQQADTTWLTFQTMGSRSVLVLVYGNHGHLGLRLVKKQSAYRDLQQF